MHLFRSFSIRHKLIAIMLLTSSGAAMLVMATAVSIHDHPIMLAMALGCFAVVLMLSLQLQSAVSGPITELRQAVTAVSQRQDYSIRVNYRNSDEIGALVDGFNQMLQHIAQRDAQLALDNLKLETEVQRREAELTDATQKHITWLENLAQFLRHELRNTSTGVKTSLDLIERRAGNDALTVYLERARKSIAYMNNLLESVSNASTLEASFQQNARTELDFSEMVRMRVSDYQTTVFPDQMIRFECPDSVVVSGNADRLTQLLDNLVTNAVEHCKPGTPIQVAVAKRGNRAELTVSNQGDRLPEDKTPLFELFVSMKNPEQQQHNHHIGLGLYIVKLIAELHGGDVRAEDLIYAEGALFRMSLPVLEVR